MSVWQAWTFSSTRSPDGAKRKRQPNAAVPESAGPSARHRRPLRQRSIRATTRIGKRAMTFPLRDGIAVLTGAAKGIGAALAMHLASRGCHLALIDRDRDALAAVASAARKTSVAVSEHAADVAAPAAAQTVREAVLAEHGR